MNLIEEHIEEIESFLPSERNFKKNQSDLKTKRAFFPLLLKKHSQRNNVSCVNPPQTE